MILDELYINGERADMGPESGIQLTYRSNIFGDITKIVGSNSSTIKLPVTARNLKLIECCVHPGSTSGYPYAYHAATVKRGGVEIVTGGSLNLMRVGADGIEVALTWGAGQELKSMDGRKLSNLAYLVDHAGGRYTTAPYNSDYTMYRRWLPDYHQGLTPGDAKKYRLPVIPVTDIIRGIASNYGIGLNVESTKHESLALPITSIKGDVGYVEYRSGTTDGARKYGYERTAVIPLGARTGAMTSYTRGTDFGLRTMYGYNIYTVRNMQDRKLNIQLSADVTSALLGVNDNANAEDVKLTIAEITLKDGVPVMNADRILADVAPIVEDVVEGLLSWKKLRYEANVDFSASRYTEFGFFLYAGGEMIPLGVSAMAWQSEVSLAYRAEYDVTMVDLDSASLNGNLPVMRNLPDLEVIKFLKAIANMCGLFAMVGSDGSGIDFVPFGRLLQNVSQAYDWSEWLIEERGGLARNLEFKVGEVAQRNVLKYKDGDVDGWDGSFTIADETLEKEKTLVELPFKPFRVVGGKASIPLFRYEKSDIEGERSILEFSGSDGPYVVSVHDGLATGDGISWSELLQSGYEEYVGMLRSARVQTELFRGSDVLLNGIDLKRPVYLRQFSSYYGIIELKTRSNNTVEAKLIKIK